MYICLNQNIKDMEKDTRNKIAHDFIDSLGPDILKAYTEYGWDAQDLLVSPTKPGLISLGIKFEAGWLWVPFAEVNTDKLLNPATILILEPQYCDYELINKVGTWEPEITQTPEDRTRE